MTLNTDIGCISTFLTEDVGCYHFRFMMDMRDAEDPVFLDKLNDLKESGHPVNWADIKPHYDRGTFGAKPDMRPFQFTCRKDPNLTLGSVDISLLRVIPGK